MIYPLFTIIDCGWSWIFQLYRGYIFSHWTSWNYLSSSHLINIFRIVDYKLSSYTFFLRFPAITGNRQCRAHGLQNARISCGEVNVRSRAYPLNTSDLWRFWRTFLEFCCGAYVFRYQRLLRGFALLLFGSSGAIGNSCRVELVGCLPFPSPMGLSSGWKALRVQQG